VTNTAPKVRQALDDMKIRSVKRNAVATHDIVNRVTPSLQAATDNKNCTGLSWTSKHVSDTLLKGN